MKKSEQQEQITTATQFKWNEDNKQHVQLKTTQGQ
jgi:hypothetical protein